MNHLIRPWAWILGAVLAAGFPAHTAEDSSPVKGTNTSLQLTLVLPPFPPRMEQGLGRTRLVLRSEPEGLERLQAFQDGRWQCLGFLEEDRSFLLIGVNARGGWVPMVSVRRLREDGSWAEATAFDRQDCLALTALLSPGGRYLIFVGGQGSVDGLYVFDLRGDTLRKLGPPPAPPPAPGLKVTCGKVPFGWGTCWADAYLAMDSGILTFPAADLLEVSYGQDGPRGRARSRQLRRFNLSAPASPGE
jgi:hypothetical protein